MSKNKKEVQILLIKYFRMIKYLKIPIKGESPKASSIDWHNGTRRRFSSKPGGTGWPGVIGGSLTSKIIKDDSKYTFIT